MQCPQCNMPLDSWRWFSAGTYVCSICHGMWTDTPTGLIAAGATPEVEPLPPLPADELMVKDSELFIENATTIRPLEGAA